jgi:hypothetical protein
MKARTKKAGRDYHKNPLEQNRPEKSVVSKAEFQE